MRASVLTCSRTLGADLRATGHVLLLTPSRGLGGGIERYADTLEWAFAAESIACRRLDLVQAGARGHMRMLAQGRALLRADLEPCHLVALHRSLLPAATLLAREASACSLSVICHGIEVWGARFRPRTVVERLLMGRPGLRVAAVSGFTAGSLAGRCQASILPPGLSREWFGRLVCAANAGRDPSPGRRLLTAFRLDAWREKGLPELIEAVSALGDDDVHLTICGTGEPPAEMTRLVAQYGWCTLRAGLKDDDLAHEFAKADIFVLATRTRHGRRPEGEGFGLVLIEAQVAGTPVIVPAHGGSCSAYVEGVTGVAPADETAGALTGVVRELLQDPARLDWMGKRAADWAREAFAPERYTQLVIRRLL
jgi:phosphatidylinositol alpha-1,6-mannosyltransferase